MSKRNNKLEILIKKNYANGANLVALLRKYKFVDFISEVIGQLNEIFSKKDFTLLPRLSAIILTKVNEKLVLIEDDEDKQNLRYFISDLLVEIPE